MTINTYIGQEVKDLKKSSFDLLVFLEEHQNLRLTQRKLSENMNVSLGLINKSLNKLLELNYISNQDRKTYQVTEDGYVYLKPFKVQRAIFFAAGFGERLLPLTQITAKALINVNGKRIIDRMLDALISKGIKEIIIVRGYLGEQFDDLLLKYPMIQLIDNENYASSKNITSAYKVKHFFSNAYIIEADIILNNPNVIQKYEFESHYKTTELTRSDSWALELQGNKISNYVLGGRNVHEILGISYWDKNDGGQLEKDLEAIYHLPGSLERFWDDIPLVLNKDKYSIMIKDYKQGDLIELKNLRQLKDLDEKYSNI